MYGAAFAAAGLQLRNIVFRDLVLFVELDHGFQLAVADSRLLILPDVLTVFTLPFIVQSFGQIYEYDMVMELNWL